MWSILIPLVLLLLWLFIAYIIFAAAGSIRESGALDVFIPSQHKKNSKKETKLLGAATEDEDHA
jgi:hypothetical protein